VIELVQAVFLGVVQGLTEFLPVSSSGHLLLSQYFLGMDPERFGLPFDAAIHTGTVIAVLWFFRVNLISMARASLRSLSCPDFSDAEVRLAYLILLATVPAALIGFFFEDFFATQVSSSWVVVFNLVFVGVLFLVAESVGRKTEGAFKLGPLGAFGVGLAQAAALVPGVSRSGATIACGLFLGLRREEEARASRSL
jgi:undecaprenyl-diphosphatase